MFKAKIRNLKIMKNFEISETLLKNFQVQG